MDLRLDNFKFTARPLKTIRNDGIKYQVKRLNGNITSSVPDIAQLRFTDLRVGFTYVVKVSTFLRSNTGAFSLVGYNGVNGVNVVTQNYKDSSQNSTTMFTVVSEPFVASSNLLTFATVNWTANEVLFGNNSNSQTNVVVYEYPMGYLKQVGNGGFSL